METKDELKRALTQEAEAGVLKLLEQLHRLPEGDLKGLEHQVMETIFEIGRAWMQSVLSEAAPEEQASGERVGSCGHQQQLVGYRPKQVLTLLGKITDHSGLLSVCSRRGVHAGRLHTWRSAC